MINEIGLATCEECYKEFDLTDPVQNDEWYMGHDCEA